MRPPRSLILTGRRLSASRKFESVSVTAYLDLKALICQVLISTPVVVFFQLWMVSNVDVNLTLLVVISSVIMCSLRFKCGCE